MPGPQYVPDPDVSPQKLKAAVAASGKTPSQAADALGIDLKRMQAILHSRAAFPPLPEFVLVIVRALLPEGEYRVPDPGEFPGFAAWAAANPSALLVVTHLADGMVNRYSETRGRGGQMSDRKRLYAEFRKYGADGEDSYWNRVLKGREPFPKDQSKLHAMCQAMQRPDDFFMNTSLRSPEMRIENDLMLLCRLAEARARAWAYDGADPNLVSIRPRDMLHRVFRRFPAPPVELIPVLTALNDGRRVDEMARQAHVPLETFVSLLLGLAKDVGKAEREQVIWSIRALLGLATPGHARPPGKRPRPADPAKSRSPRTDPTPDQE